MSIEKLKEMRVKDLLEAGVSGFIGAKIKDVAKIRSNLVEGKLGTKMKNVYSRIKSLVSIGSVRADDVVKEVGLSPMGKMPALGRATFAGKEVSTGPF